jgi:hypothetical protein
MSDMTLVWHVGRCTWLACWYKHMIGTPLVHVFSIWLIHSINDGTLYGVDVHGCCAWWAHNLVHDVLG